MDFIFYRYKGKPNVLDKGLSDGRTISGEFNQQLNLSNCRIKLSFIDFFDENYVYIPKIGRYYFITNKIFHRSGLLYLDCHIDVLMSYKDSINGFKIMLDNENVNECLTFESEKIMDDGFKTIMVTLGG